MSLFKKYKKNVKFSNSLSNNMGIVPCISIYFIPLDRPKNQLLCDMYYVYETLGGYNDIYTATTAKRDLLTVVYS